MEENKDNTFKSVGFCNNKGRGVGKTVFISFLSGIVGASLVVGTCFGIPEVKEKIIGNQKEITEETKQTSTQVNATAVSLTQYSDTAIGVAAKVLPSIVGIEIEYSVNSIFGKSTGSATGSGIIISEDGYILTNNHVVNSTSSNSYYQVSTAGAIKVKLYNDETVYDAKIIGTDDQTDLAVIKIEKTGLTAAEFGNSDNVVVGEFAMAIGNPLGLATSATCGIISAVNRDITTSDNKKYTVIQTDAAINSGNSGGALVNSKGQVIGINTLKLSGDGVEGIGFAIPISSTTDISKQLIDHNKVIRPYVGIEGMGINKETAERYKLVEGVYIKVVEDFGAAQKAGIKAGDVITEFDGKQVKTVEEITELKNKHNIGDTIKIKIFRNGEYKDIDLILGEQP